MNAARLIEQVRAVGGRIEVKGITLKLAAPKPLPDDLMAELRAHKNTLMTYLIAGRYGLTVEELRDLAGKNWPDLEANPALLEGFAEIVSIRKMRERGEVPPTYTAMTVCRHCGPVPIFPGVADKVEGCPWCMNRAAGKPIPRPTNKLNDSEGSP